MTLSAFGPYAKKQCIDFSKLGDRSLFLIHGRTGSGKTTILDAISYALYGVSSGDRKGKQMRSDHAASSAMTEVTFDFSLGTKRYRVVRRPEQERQKKRGEGKTLERNAATLFELNLDNTEKAVLADQWTKVTEKVEGLFGFKADQFRQVVLLPQGSFRRLLLAPSKDREQILQSLFHTHIYRSLEEHLKQQSKELKDELESFKQQKSELLHGRNVESLEQLRSKLTDERRRLKRSDEQLKSTRVKAEEWQEKLKKARLELRAWDEYVEAKGQLNDLLEKKPAFDLSRDRLAKASKANPLRNQYQSLMKLERGFRELNEQQEATLKILNERELLFGLREKINPFTDSVKAKSQELFSLQSLLSRGEDLEQQGRKLTELESERSRLAIALSEKDHERCGIDQRLIYIGLNQSRRVEIESELQEAFRERERLENVLGQFEKQKSINETLASKTALFQEAEAEFNEFWQSLQLLRTSWLQDQCVKALEDLIEKESDWPSRVVNIMSQERALIRLQVQQERFVSGEGEAILNRGALLSELERVKTELKGLQMKLSKAPGGSLEQEKQLRIQQEKLQKESEKLHDELESCKGQISFLGDFIATSTDDSSYKSMEALKDQHLKLGAEYEALEQQQQQWSLEADRLHGQLVQSRARQQSGQEALDRDLKKLTEHREHFSRALHHAGFQCPQDLSSQQLEDEEFQRLTQSLAVFEGQLAASQSRFERAREGIVGLEKAPEIQLIERQLQESQRVLEQSIARRSAHSLEVEQGSRALARLIKLERKVKRLRKRYQHLGHLSEVASGKNDYRLSFQRFVLAALLDDVLLNASEHLQRMSKGRFQLQRARLRHDKRLTGGLDLEIYDAYTGTCRAVPTLSGGESFLAALSLALGLADVVQSYSGGIHLETIFVDEGFGSLDPESLDLALDTFIDLQKGGRLVGIISHVPELKERIDARLTVTSTRSGSHASFN